VHAKKLNRRKNIPRSFRGATFLKHPVVFGCTDKHFTTNTRFGVAIVYMYCHMKTFQMQTAEYVLYRVAQKVRPH